MTEYDEYVREHGFKPRRVGDPPPPKEAKPRCSVEGCSRVVYKSVVCRKHWGEIPLDLRIRRSIDAATAAMASTAASDLEIMGLAQSLSKDA